MDVTLKNSMNIGQGFGLLSVNKLVSWWIFGNVSTLIFLEKMLKSDTNLKIVVSTELVAKHKDEIRSSTIVSQQHICQRSRRHVRDPQPQTTSKVLRFLADNSLTE